MHWVLPAQGEEGKAPEAGETMEAKTKQSYNSILRNNKQSTFELVVASKIPVAWEEVLVCCLLLLNTYGRCLKGSVRSGGLFAVSGRLVISASLTLSLLY